MLSMKVVFNIIFIHPKTGAFHDFSDSAIYEHKTSQNRSSNAVSDSVTYMYKQNRRTKADCAIFNLIQKV